MSAPFSYAQAAKSRPSPSSNPSTSQSPSAPSPQLGGINPASMNGSKQSWAEDGADARTVVEDGPSHSNHHQGSKPLDLEPLDDHPVQDRATQITAQPEEPTGHGVLHEEASQGELASTASMDPSTEKTLEKDLASNTSSIEPNGHHESTWAAEKDEAAASKPAAKALKVAPPPAVNFWTQRAQTLKAQQDNHQTDTKPPTSPNGVQQQMPTAEGGSTPKVAPYPSKTGSKVPTDATTAVQRPTQQGIGKQNPTRSHNGSIRPALPTVRDDVSWPTPEDAQDESRKKSQDRPEKPETERAPSATRPHGKSEWKPVPFTPSVKFNTPLPPATRRGGRGGGRGGRETGGRAGSLSVAGSDKPSSADIEAESNPRGASDAISGQYEATKERRSASESHASPREPRVTSPGDQGKRPSLQEGGAAASSAIRQAGSGRKSKPTLDRIAPPQNGAPTSAEAHDDKSSGDNLDHSRRRSNAHYTDHSAPNSAISRPKARNVPLSAPLERTFEPNVGPTFDEDIKETPKSTWTSKSAIATSRAPETAKSQTLEGAPSRERSEARSERGRGGRSGRGGFSHHSGSQHPSTTSFANGNTPTTPHSATFGRFNTNFPPAFSPNVNQAPHNARNFRPSPRSSSIPSEHNGRWQPVQMPTVYAPSTTFGNNMYETGYPAVAPLPYAMPVMYDHMALVNEVAYQLNYYFSLDNLIKDTFLRKHMDGKGFVLLSLVANFKKMKMLTTDLAFIKMVCVNLDQFEVQHGIDGNDRIRKREGWDQWLLPVDQRDVSAQHDGVEAKDQPRFPLEGAPDPSNPFAAQGVFIPGAEGLYPPSEQNPNFTSPPGGASANGSTSPLPRNNRYSLPLLDSDLYRPLASPIGGAPATNGQNDELDAFPDEQIDSLTVVARPENQATPKQPRHSEASRTFSNGSIDALGIEAHAEEERRSRSRLDVLGGSEAERSSRLSSPHGLTSSASPDPSRRDTVGLFWIKNKDNAPVPMPEGSASEPYSHLHFRALQQRQTAERGQCPHDMQILYQFWSHFLIRNFNTTMYEEFHRFSHEDLSAGRGSDGMDNLIKYYKEALSSHHIIRERVAKDFVNLVKNEDPSSSRPAFKQLKSAWRDGALNLRNRKKIMDIVDSALKFQLDK